MYCPDNYDAFVAYEERREREYQEWKRKLPLCSECGNPIEDEECIKIGDKLYCEECIENMKVCTENYMKE